MTCNGMDVSQPWRQLKILYNEVKGLREIEVLEGLTIEENRFLGRRENCLVFDQKWNRLRWHLRKKSSNLYSYLFHLLLFFSIIVQKPPPFFSYCEQTSLVLVLQKRFLLLKIHSFSKRVINGCHLRVGKNTFREQFVQKRLESSKMVNFEKSVSYNIFIFHYILIKNNNFYFCYRRLFLFHEP